MSVSHFDILVVCKHIRENWPLAKRGRKASAGRPRIPSDATIVFEVEMVGIPGKEVELIELIGDY